MRIDFRGVEDVQSYVYVPPGTYVCRVAEVRPGSARDGSARWSLRLEVAEGDQLGRTAAWDSLTWSDRGVARVKLVLKALGVPTQGVVEIEPQDLVGRRARVTVQPEERENAQTGLREVRNRVPYAGIEAVAAATTSGADLAVSSALADEVLDEVPFGIAPDRGRGPDGTGGEWGASKEEMAMTRSTSAGGVVEMDEDESYAATQVSELGSFGMPSAAEACLGGQSGGGGGSNGGFGCSLGDGDGASDGGGRLSGAGGADAALHLGPRAAGLSKQSAGTVASCGTASEPAPPPKKRGRPRKHPLPAGAPVPQPAKPSPTLTPKPKSRGF